VLDGSPEPTLDADEPVVMGNSPHFSPRQREHAGRHLRTTIIARLVSRENLEIIRQSFDAFAQNDFEAWFAVASTDIKLYPRREEPGVKPVYNGWDELLEYLINWYSGWEDYTVAAERFIDAGDYVIVDVTEVGIAEHSGARVEENFAHAFKLHDGKIVEWRMYGPVDEALAALDLQR
jgi:ketosteroid isomerase-like protein